jgi:hypothetical protein
MSQTTTTSGKLEMRLLGPVSLAIDGAPVEERVWTRRKAKALLKILALAPHHQLHREQLLDLLWPELEPELAANNLNKVIHSARRALEPGLKAGGDSRFLHTHDQQVSLSAPGGLWIDAEAFEQAAQTALKSRELAAYETALALYAGHASVARGNLRPVATFQRFSTEDDSSYRLAGYLWTQQLERAHRVAMRLRAGTVWINTPLFRDLRAPFGGIKQSGFGREGGRYGLEFYTYVKTLCLALQPPALPKPGDTV